MIYQRPTCWVNILELQALIKTIPALFSSAHGFLLGLYDSRLLRQTSFSQELLRSSRLVRLLIGTEVLGQRFGNSN